jgi:non-ribosomal peptide synthetase component F
MNEHSGLLNRLCWAQDYFKLTPKDKVLQKTTYSFDVSVWELLWPLISGAQLVFAKPGGHKDNVYLKEVIEKEQITMLHFVPSMLEVFLSDLPKEACPSLKQVLCSGEALKPSQVELFGQKLPQTKLFNLYGPTEAAIDVTCWEVEPNRDGSNWQAGSQYPNIYSKPTKPAGSDRGSRRNTYWRGTSCPRIFEQGRINERKIYTKSVFQNQDRATI